jgi:hypothetical protein
MVQVSPHTDPSSIIVDEVPETLMLLLSPLCLLEGLRMKDHSKLSRNNGKMGVQKQFPKKSVIWIVVGPTWFARFDVSPSA